MPRVKKLPTRREVGVEGQDVSRPAPAAEAHTVASSSSIIANAQQANADQSAGAGLPSSAASVRRQELERELTSAVLGNALGSGLGLAGVDPHSLSASSHGSADRAPHLKAAEFKARKRALNGEQRQAKRHKANKTASPSTPVQPPSINSANQVGVFFRNGMASQVKLAAQRPSKPQGGAQLNVRDHVVKTPPPGVDMICVRCHEVDGKALAARIRSMRASQRKRNGFDKYVQDTGVYLTNLVDSNDSTATAASAWFILDDTVVDSAQSPDAAAHDRASSTTQATSLIGQHSVNHHHPHQQQLRRVLPAPSIKLVWYIRSCWREQHSEDAANIGSSHVPTNGSTDPRAKPPTAADAAQTHSQQVITTPTNGHTLSPNSPTATRWAVELVGRIAFDASMVRGRTSLKDQQDQAMVLSFLLGTDVPTPNSVETDDAHSILASSTASSIPATSAGPASGAATASMNATVVGKAQHVHGRGRCPYDISDTAQIQPTQVYAVVREKLHSTPTAQLPAGMAHSLRPYQRKALRWMQWREMGERPRVDADDSSDDAPAENAADNSGPDQLEPASTQLVVDANPLFIPIVVNGHLCGLDRVSFWLCDWPPHPARLDVRGGILADEMGLGKTVEVLALVRSRPAPLLRCDAQEATATNESDPPSTAARDGSDSEAGAQMATDHDTGANASVHTDQEQSGGDEWDGSSASPSEQQTDSDEDPAWQPGSRSNGRTRVVLRRSRNRTRQRGGQDTEWCYESGDDEEYNAEDDLVERLYCYCNAQTEREVRRRGKLVTCIRCKCLQHARCTGFAKECEVDPGAAGRGFICFDCLLKAEHLSSVGATLVISPLAIAHQWVDEARKHCPDLNVLEYGGVSRDGCVRPGTLNVFDVIVTTYDVLKSEQAVAAAQQNSARPKLRHQRRHPPAPSPLRAVNWWRVCLDEAQQVESGVTKAAEMARGLEATHRWCVTGTPSVSNAIKDLQGLFGFLLPSMDTKYVECLFNAHAKALVDTSTQQPLIPTCDSQERALVPSTNQLQALVSADRPELDTPVAGGGGRWADVAASLSVHAALPLLNQLLWRTTKDMVAEEYSLPPLTEHPPTMIKLSDVEAVFYRQQQKFVQQRLLRRLSRTRFPDDTPISSLPSDILKSVTAEVTRLRQACCHPGLVLAKRKKKQDKHSGEAEGETQLSRLPTMDQVANEMVTEGATKCSELFRTRQVALNGLAAALWLKGDLHQAFEIYRQVIQETETFRHIFVPDKFAYLHSLCNAAECLEALTNSKVVVPNNMRLRQSWNKVAEDIRADVSSRAQARVNCLESSLQKFRQPIEGTRKLIPVVLDVINWLDASGVPLAAIVLETLARAKTEGNMGKHWSGGMHTNFTDVTGLQYHLSKELEATFESRHVLIDKIKHLMARPTAEELSEAAQCQQCRSEWSLVKRPPAARRVVERCKFCELFEAIDAYEARVMTVAKPSSMNRRKADEAALQEQDANDVEDTFKYLKSRGWSVPSQRPTEAEVALETILNIAKTRRAPQREELGAMVDFMSTLKREFFEMRSLATALYERVSVLDELVQCTTRMQLVGGRPDDGNGSNHQVSKGLPPAASSRAEAAQHSHASAAADDDDALAAAGTSTFMDADFDGAEAFAVTWDQLDQVMVINRNRAAEAEMELSQARSNLTFLRTLTKPEDSSVRCPVCYETELEAMALTRCGHSVCTNCLKRLVSAGRFKCPACRARWPMESIRRVRLSKAGLNGKDSGHRLGSEQDGKAAAAADIGDASADRSDAGNTLPVVKGSQSSKVARIMQTLLGILAEDPSAKCIVFSQWRLVLEFLGVACMQNGILAMNASEGSTRKIAQHIAAFKHGDSPHQILLLPLALGSNGLNLTEATHVLFAEPVLHVGVELQAISRIHRFGQTKPTHVHRFITSDTVEEMVMSFASEGAGGGMRSESDEPDGNNSTRTHTADAAAAGLVTKDMHRNDLKGLTVNDVRRLVTSLYDSGDFSAADGEANEVDGDADGDGEGGPLMDTAEDGL